MKSKHAGRVIHPFRTSGVNSPGYSRPAASQWSAQPPQAAPQPSAPHTAPNRPQDARTVEEGIAGLMRAAAGPPLHYRLPTFPDTKGSWIRIGDHECRVPQNAIVSVQQTSNGRSFAVVAGTNTHDGKLWILLDTANGIRELVGVPWPIRNDLRRQTFGQS